MVRLLHVKGEGSQAQSIWLESLNSEENCLVIQRQEGDAYFLSSDISREGKWRHNEGRYRPKSDQSWAYETSKGGRLIRGK